jgi:hypothetical protein
MHKLKSGFLQLGAQQVKVHVVRKLYARETIYGEAKTSENIIRLAGDVAATQAVDTLLHEIGHFLLAGNPLTDKDEEYIVGALGRGLASLFRDNPEWIESILKIFREEANRCQPKSTHKQTKAVTRTNPRARRRSSRPRRT